MQKVFVKCSVSSGMFPEERTVSFEEASGKTVSIFVPDKLIQDESFEAELLEEDSKTGLSLIKLPTYSASTSPHVVVKSELLTKMSEAVV